jgi:hypothetical protein
LIPERTPQSFARSISSNILVNFCIFPEFIIQLFEIKKVAKSQNLTGL